MAPVTQKRAAEQAEAEVEDKKRKVEGEEKSEEEEVEIGDDEDADEDDEMMSQEALMAMLSQPGAHFDKEDFDEELKITDEQLEKFNKAFEEFMSKLEENHSCPMVMGKPVAIRPVPTTVAEFEEKLPFINLEESVTKFSDEVREALEEGNQELNDKMEAAEEPEGEDEDEEAFQKKLDENMKVWHRELMDHQFKVFEKYVGVVEELTKGEEKKDIWGKFIVFTDAVFDEDVHQLFCEEEDKERVVGLVARLETAWNTMAALKDEDIGATPKLRKDTAGMIANMQAALNKGDFAMAEDDEEEEEEEEEKKEPKEPLNPHKETKFCPKLC